MKQNKEEILKFWQNCPANLQSMFLNSSSKQLDELERQEIFTLLPSLEGKKVLELGSGIGRLTKELAKRAKSIVSVELCPHFLEASQVENRSFSNIEYQCINAMDANFASGSFDFVFISWLLMYLTDPEVKTLSRKILNWLKPGGLLFFKESCAPTRCESQYLDYFAIYRSIFDYQRLFQKKWELVAEGNIRAYEDLQADPFKCFWLYKKR